MGNKKRIKPIIIRTIPTITKKESFIQQNNHDILKNQSIFLENKFTT
jgi:hypothetical protein